MGSFNSSCAITGLPLKDKALLLLWSSTPERAYSGLPIFYGAPLSASYEDYGNFTLEEPNPFNTWLKPDMEEGSGFLLHYTCHDVLNSDKELPGYNVSGINLWTAYSEALNLYHELILIRAKLSLQKIKIKYSQNADVSVLDFEGGSNTKSVIKEKYPEIWAEYVSLMADCPLSYESRANSVHTWLDDENFFMQLCKDLCESEESAQAAIVRICERIYCKDILAEVKEKIEDCLKERLFTVLHISAVHPTAFNKMVECAKNQLGQEKTKKLLEKALKKEESSDIDLSTMDPTSKGYSVLKRMRNRELRGNEKLGLFRVMGYANWDRKNLSKLVLFEQNFNHGFKFSSMTEYRQYEGIAHIEAVANATLEVIAEIKEDLYKTGNWETYMI